MDIDIYKKNLTNEQKLGKYNISLCITKILSIVIFLLLQAIIIVCIFKHRYTALVYFCISLIAISHLFLFNKVKEYKVVWLVLIVLFPIMGALMYSLIGDNSFSKNQEKKLNDIEEENKKLTKNTNYMEIKELHEINQFSTYRIYKNQGIVFFNTGEDFFNYLLKELENAKKSILIDIYILSKGMLLDKILDVLMRKSKEGIIVELMFDNLGSMFKVPKEIKESLIESGIKLYEYKKIGINISDYVNHREHKKIILIDGKIAYTGGINISDEYVNEKELHGTWKDGGIKVCGDVAISYLLMYLKTKEEITNKKSDVKKYIIDKEFKDKDGFIFAYSDGPDNLKNPVENVFLNIINLSQDYLYIVTPYFIPSKKIINSIKNAVSRGVDVRILLPYIPDKKIVQHANRAYYRELIKSGVKLYEYKKGFIHSKYLVTDDISIVGTANLDYRSLYFNYECMNLSYKTGIEKCIKEEFEKDIKESICINLKNVESQSIVEKIEGKIAKFLAPLL